MSTLATLDEQPEVRTIDGRLIVIVHWRAAEDLHSHLQRRGIPSVNSWDPIQRQACLHLAAEMDEARVRTAVQEWLN